MWVRVRVHACLFFSLALLESRCNTVDTCSSDTSTGESRRGRCGTVAGLYVFRDAAVRGELMTEGCAELWELQFGLASAEQVTGGVWRR